MSYLEVSFELGSLDAAAAEAGCFETGAMAVTFRDAVDQPVFEPAPGEMRLWQQTRLQALFDGARADASMLTALASSLGLPVHALQVRAVPDRIWEREWLRDFHATRFGRRLWICPRHERVTEADAVVVRLDPGLAFGTGTHASTALCLSWLDAEPLQDLEVIDYGCGAGTLAIAALKLGARRAHAYDIDPQALLATGENALDNGVAGRLQIHETERELPTHCALLMANILADVLIRLQPRFAALLPRAGRILLSGLLQEQEAEVSDVFARDFELCRCAQREGWIALAGTRR
jgi:ribosomal protein L11 methyltransferase